MSEEKPAAQENDEDQPNPFAEQLGVMLAELGYVMRVIATELAKIPGAQPKRLARALRAERRKLPDEYDLARLVLSRMEADVRRVKGAHRRRRGGL